jgi:Ni/Fe-hydrogenase subunit HybB-like protein
MPDKLRVLGSLLTPWRVILALLLTASAVIVFFRFAFGLGSVTNLSDEMPWGIWVGFDILAGIGLAAGGFIMAAAVYVFGLERYRPLLRMSILTALLGYLLFITGLILEIGRPWNIWRCIVNHNIHSPLFEIAWCVMLYTTVLLLEFSQVVFERFGWHRLEAWLHRILVPLVIVGVLLSTLHQSTLGTLFTIVPNKLHALWYSPILPVHFFISCLAAGLAMICFEGFLSWRFLGHPPRLDLLPNLARLMALILVVYFVFRIQDLALRGALPLAFVVGMPALLFWLENFLFVILPVIIVFRTSQRMTTTALFVASFSTVIGFIMHRFNVAVTGMQLVHDVGYFPTWQELVISMTLIALGFIAAGLAVTWLPITRAGGGDASSGVRGAYRLSWRPAESRSSTGIGGGS